MAKGTIYVPVAGTGEAPQDYVVPGAAILDLEAVYAGFDGSGAAVDFLPCVRIIDSSGNLMAQVVGETVAAGDYAAVTFAPFLNQGRSATPTGSGVFVANLWFDNPLFGDPLVSVPAGAGLDVPFANTFVQTGAPMSVLTVTNPNDTLSLDSADHLFLISSSSFYSLGGFVQQTLLQTAAPTIFGGELFGNISLHSVHPADYFNLVQPIAGSTQGQIDYMLVKPETAGQTVTLHALHNSGTAKNLQKAFIAALAFPLA